MRTTTLLLALAVLAATAAAVAEAEPNNDFGIAQDVALGEGVTGTVSPAGDADFYRLTTDRPGVVTASVTGVPAAMRPSVTIYSSYLLSPCLQAQLPAEQAS
jgi:hypothetical protein